MPPYQDHLGDYQSENNCKSIFSNFSALISLKVRPKIQRAQDSLFFQYSPPKKIYCFKGTLSTST